MAFSEDAVVLLYYLLVWTIGLLAMKVTYFPRIFQKLLTPLTIGETKTGRNTWLAGFCLRENKPRGLMSLMESPKDQSLDMIYVNDILEWYSCNMILYSSY